MSDMFYDHRLPTYRVSDAQDSDSNADTSDFASASITPHSIASFSPANDSPFGGMLRGSDDGFAVPSYPPSASASPGGTPEEFPSMFARRLSLNQQAANGKVGHSHMSVARQLKVDVAPQPAIVVQGSGYPQNQPQHSYQYQQAPQQQQQQQHLAHQQYQHQQLQQQQQQQQPQQQPAPWEFEQGGLFVDDAFQGVPSSVSGLGLSSPFTTPANCNNSFDVFGGGSGSSIFTPVDAGLPYGTWPMPSPSPLSSNGAFFFNTVDVQTRPSKKAKHFGSMNMDDFGNFGGNVFHTDDPTSENCPPQLSNVPAGNVPSGPCYPGDAKTYGDLMAASASAPSCTPAGDLPEPPQSGMFQSSRISPRQWPAASVSSAAASSSVASSSFNGSSSSPRCGMPSSSSSMSVGSSFDVTSSYLQQLPPVPSFAAPPPLPPSSHHSHVHYSAVHMGHHPAHPLPPPPPFPSSAPHSHGHAHAHAGGVDQSTGSADPDGDCDSLGYSDDDDRSDVGEEGPEGQVYGLHKLSASHMSPYRAMSHNPSLCNSECSSPCQSRASSAPTSPGPSGRKKRYRVNHACATCKKSKTKCDNQRPCERCVRTGRAESCIDSVHKKRGRKKKTVKRKLRTKLVPSTGRSQVKEEDEEDEVDFDDGYDSPASPPVPVAPSGLGSALPVRRAISFHSSSATASPQSSTSSLGLPPLPRATSDS